MRWLIEWQVGGGTVALVDETGHLCDLLRDAPSDSPQSGDVYAGRFNGAFRDTGGGWVELGEGATGFLPSAEGVRAGSVLPLQVTRAAEGNKQARLRLKIELKSRHLIFTPAHPGINAAKSLEGAARYRAALAPLGEAGGFVIRSNACEVTPEMLLTEAEHLCDRWRAARFSRPGRVISGGGALGRAVRDFPAPQRILIAQDDTRSAPMIRALAPGLEALIEVGPAPLTHADCEGQILALTSPLVSLPEGGDMRVERTAAAVLIDVNSGRGHAGAMNEVAAKAIPRQLKLRGWGGAVLIDFAHVQDKATQRHLQTLLNTAFIAEGLEARLKGFGPLGFCELTLKADRVPI